MMKKFLYALIVLNFSFYIRAETVVVVPRYDYSKGLGTFMGFGMTDKIKCQTITPVPGLSVGREIVFDRLGITDPDEMDLYKKHFDNDSLNREMTCEPDPAILKRPCKGTTRKIIRGHQKYVGGIVMAPYSYFLSCLNGVRHIDVAVHLEMPKLSNNKRIKVSNDYCLRDKGREGFPWAVKGIS